MNCISSFRVHLFLGFFLMSSIGCSRSGASEGSESNSNAKFNNVDSDFSRVYDSLPILSDIQLIKVLNGASPLTNRLDSTFVRKFVCDCSNLCFFDKDANNLTYFGLGKRVFLGNVRTVLIGFNGTKLEATYLLITFDSTFKRQGKLVVAHTNRDNSLIKTRLINEVEFMITSTYLGVAQDDPSISRLRKYSSTWQLSTNGRFSLIGRENRVFEEN